MVWPVYFTIFAVAAASCAIACSKHRSKSTRKPPPHVGPAKKEVVQAPIKMEAPRPAVKKEEIQTAPPSKDKEKEPTHEKGPSPSPCQPKVIFEMDTKKEEKFPRPDFDKELPNILPMSQQPRKAAEEEIEIDVDIEIEPPAGEGASKKEARKKESQKNESLKKGNSIEIVE